MKKRNLENHPMLVKAVSEWHGTLESVLLGHIKYDADVVEQLSETDVYRCNVIIEGSSEIQDLIKEICNALNSMVVRPVIAQRISNKVYGIGGVSRPLEVREHFVFNDNDERKVRTVQFVIANVIKDHVEKLVAECKRDIGAETDE